MQIKINASKWKRFFSVPCALVDEYLRLADAAAIKLLLFLMCDESDNQDKNVICKKCGINADAFDDAVIFWQELGVLSSDDNDNVQPSVSENNAAKSVTAINVSDVDINKSDKADISAANDSVRVLHAKFTPKDITKMLDENGALKELFFEAEQTLGRILKHCDHEMLINLVDYYGFSPQSVVLILEHCRDLDKTSARYIESVAADFFDNGITDFLDIDAEINRRKAFYSFENRVKHEFGIDTKLSSKQVKFIMGWQDLGFGLDMISIAREKCVNATNKLSFAYIDKILRSWADKKIFKPEEIEADVKQQPVNNDASGHSFDLDEFEQFTIQNKPTL